MSISSRLRSFLLLPVLLLSLSTPANADGGKFGAGIVLGEPTALSAKLWTTNINAFDFGLSYAFDDYFALFSDYLWHFPGAFGRSSPFVSQLSPYVGIGGIIIIADDDYLYGRSRKDRDFFGREDSNFGLGMRIPFGIEWRPARPPFGIFVELVPGISLIPDTSGFFEAGIGARYYF